MRGLAKGIPMVPSRQGSRLYREQCSDFDNSIVKLSKKKGYLPKYQTFLPHINLRTVESYSKRKL